MSASGRGRSRASQPRFPSATRARSCQPAADLTVVSLKKGEFGFIDVGGGKMMGNQKLECELTLREGRVVWDLNGIVGAAVGEAAGALGRLTRLYGREDNPGSFCRR